MAKENLNDELVAAVERARQAAKKADRDYVVVAKVRENEVVSRLVLKPKAEGEEPSSLEPWRSPGGQSS